MNYLFVYITASDRKEAETISDALISERLVACTNIIDTMSALFWWDGGVQSEDEVVLIAKTTAEAFPKLEQRVLDLHSYECPCIIGMPIASGYQGYLDWISEEVRPGSKRQS
ncbi:divalent-cation tolerance protein CutA [Natronogracilivirga saccharolytica]|uniref:Divalent-cation tolerance protein CutA n=1 Tax=Natronogracilivirga saccharolytica TaxID=2812953 RepID=A0A8J7S9F0_9BACT|nr:divalent-cation tolerance protein CutA [Natronogracilivirga saccharolytica]MBP3192833.1 divalent-cation tolerance protein CutA [Natronogracilivirga saccharolytica]